MVQDDNLKTIKCCSKNKVFSTDRLLDSWRLMLSANLCTKKIIIADLKNHNLMADKLGVFNISNSKENEDCFSLEVPIQKCWKWWYQKTRSDWTNTYDVDKSTSTNVENWCSQKNHMYKGSKIMNYKLQNLIAIKLDVFTKPNSKRVENCWSQKFLDNNVPRRWSQKVRISLQNNMMFWLSTGAQKLKIDALKQTMCDNVERWWF